MNGNAVKNRKSYLKQKLVAATAMLLVAGTMLVGTSFAWFVLSTAPEVTNIKTQVGANGALEIALLNQASWNNLDLLDMGDIDESAAAYAVDANLTWGNLINLGDESYGLDKIVLNPARLNIKENGTDDEGVKQFLINPVLLKTPVYGEDGRIQSLEEKAVSYICNNGLFDSEGYGVRAIGTSASMSIFQMGMNDAVSLIVTNMAAARTSASSVLNQTGGDLANIVIKYALEDKRDGYTDDDIIAIKALAEGLGVSLDSVETALRYTFAGYIATATAAEKDGITLDNYSAALEEILNPDTTLGSLFAKYGDIVDIIPDMGTYVTKLDTEQTNVQTAIVKCTEKENDAEGTTYTWGDIIAIVNPLINTGSITVFGKTMEELQSADKDELINLVLNGNGIKIVVPTGSGVLSTISDFAGDYSAKVTVEEVTAMGQTLKNITAVMTTDTSIDPVYLTVCRKNLKGAPISDATGNNSITDYYGYAIDLAFRTNAENSNLLLQTEPENRVYEGDNSNAALQGKGSYMSFKTLAGLSATKMVKLMRGIRVVLMDENQKVLGIAALDCALGQDVYTVLTEEQTPEKYAYLDGSASDYQISDLISQTEYNALPVKSNVEFNTTETGEVEVKAKLYMYSFSLTENSNGQKTGGLTLGTKNTSAAITALEPDVVKRVTALVYIDGSVVNNSMVAANSAQSMTGKLNLQFSSDATLVPAENTALRSGDDSE